MPSRFVKPRGGAEKPIKPQTVGYFRTSGEGRSQQLAAAEASGAAGAPSTQPEPAAMEGNLPSGLPDQAARGRQDGRGLGEVLAPQPLETGPAVRAEAPAEVVAAAESGLPSSEQVAAAGAGARPEQGAAAEGVPPEQVAAAQGAAATDGAQPEQVQVAAAMDFDSPVRAETPVRVTRDVTAAAMEGVPVEGQADVEEAPPGPLAMVVYSGGASGAAAAVGAAMATELSPVRSAAPVTPAPARPVLTDEVVGRQRTRFTMEVFRQASRVKPCPLGKVPGSPITPEFRAKRKATQPVAGGREIIPGGLEVSGAASVIGA